MCIYFAQFNNSIKQLFNIISIAVIRKDMVEIGSRKMYYTLFIIRAQT